MNQSYAYLYAYMDMLNIDIDIHIMFMSTYIHIYIYLGPRHRHTRPLHYTPSATHKKHLSVCPLGLKNQYHKQSTCMCQVCCPLRCDALSPCLLSLLHLVIAPHHIGPLKKTQFIHFIHFCILFCMRSQTQIPYRTYIA